MENVHRIHRDSSPKCYNNRRQRGLKYWAPVSSCMVNNSIRVDAPSESVTCLLHLIARRKWRRDIELRSIFAACDTDI